MLTSEKLHQLYPTPAPMLEVRKRYQSWSAMARGIGVSKDSLYQHRKALGIDKAKGSAIKDENSYADRLTVAQIDENFQQLIKGESKNVVTRYRITDLEAFKQDQRGYAGLELVNTEQGTTWNQVSHKVSVINR